MSWISFFLYNIFVRRQAKELFTCALHNSCHDTLRFYLVSRYVSRILSRILLQFYRFAINKINKIIKMIGVVNLALF